jgi:hypothetical protein
MSRLGFFTKLRRYASVNFNAAEDVILKYKDIFELARPVH